MNKFSAYRTFTQIIILSFLGNLTFSSFSAENQNTEQKSDELPVEQLRIFAEVYNRIKSNYVEDVDDQTLLKGAINGMLNSLDPHSAFLDKDAYKNIIESSAGQYGGLGIEVFPENNAIRIITPIDNSPAKRAGILPGDEIVRINNTPLRNIKAEDAMELMRGELGEKVELSIRRKGESELLDFNLVREIIQTTSINSRWLGGGIAYLRITQFQKRTGNDLIETIEQLKDEHEGKISGLILDLRNNPGGVLPAAESVSDSFLNEGLIISTKAKVSTSDYQLSAKQGDIIYGAPIVVLINSGSASAAEIVAGALQDHKRAVIMGTRSFGKGSVQTLMPISDSTALKLTTARYYTPSGRSIQGTGIAPDIEVQQAEIVRKDKKGKSIYESDLKGALLNELTKPENDNAAKEKQIQAFLENDFQVSEALNLLRGITILSLKNN